MDFLYQRLSFMFQCYCAIYEYKFFSLETNKYCILTFPAQAITVSIICKCLIIFCFVTKEQFYNLHRYATPVNCLSKTLFKNMIYIYIFLTLFSIFYLSSLLCAIFGDSPTLTLLNRYYLKTNYYRDIMTPVTWHLTPDTWHLTPGTWHMTSDIWHMVGSEHSL